MSEKFPIETENPKHLSVLESIIKSSSWFQDTQFNSGKLHRDSTDGEMGMVEMKFLKLLTKYNYATNAVFLNCYFIL